MAFKMKGHALPGIKQRSGGKGTPGHEPAVKSTDYLMKTPNPTTASNSAKEKYEDEDATTFSKPTKTAFDKKPYAEQERYMNEEHHSIVPKIGDFINDAQNKKKSAAKMYGKKSPAKIAPLIAMAGKAIIGGVVKKAMEKDSPAKMCGCGKKKCNC